MPDHSASGHDPTTETSSPQALFDEVCDLLQRGDPRANNLLPRLQAYPQHAQGWLQLGRVLTRLEQSGAAMVAFDQALAARQAPLAAALEKADLMIASGQPADAARWLAEIQQRGNDDVRLTHRLGRAHYAAGNLEAAHAALQAAVDQAPDFAEAWFHLGLVEQDLDRPAAAATAYGKALSARPGMFEAALNLGISLQDTGAMEPAMDAYAQAVRIEPGCFNRVAQALTSASTGRLWLDPNALRRSLAART
ncbi:tetratricopeptide repeat protein [Salinisphaera hydrothermalis]|uniref:tetratricopeptide repeat protein n=1 Tax=Salinisphaera hydrothermalis TaxID=563188 RepID=UPI003341EC43